MRVLINGDCLTELRKLPDNCADVVVTSPPYNMNLRIMNGKYKSRQIVKEISSKYEGFDDNMPMDDYFEFNKSVMTELLRCSDLVFYNVQFLTGNKPALFKLIGEFSNKIKEFIIWDKVNAEPAIQHGVMNSRYECVIVLQNSAPESRMFNNAHFDRGTLQNLWQIKKGRKLYKNHGAVFPEELVDKILTNFTQEGDIVLDPFMGTGTTGVVCTRMNRGFIGIELTKSYYDICNERISHANP